MTATAGASGTAAKPPEKTPKPLPTRKSPPSGAGVSPANNPRGVGVQPASLSATGDLPAPKTARDLWAQLLATTTNSARTQSMLRAATPISWEGQNLTVEITGPVKAVLEHRCEEIEKLLRSLVSRKVKLIICEPDTTDNETTTELPPDPKTLAAEHPLVKHAMDLFNGRVERASLKKKP